jgi:hypothetical protein
MSDAVLAVGSFLLAGHDRKERARRRQTYLERTALIFQR